MCPRRGMSSVGGQNAQHMSSAGGQAAQQLGKRRRVREGLAVVGLLAGLVGGASLSVYLVARQLDEQWDDVGVAGMISLMPRKFQVDDVKQPRPGRPYTFRLDGEDVDSGKAFKYVFACRTREEHGSWCKALRALSKADPAELEAGGVAQVILDGLEHDGWMELEATASQKAKNKVEQAKDRSGRALAQQAATIGALEDEASTLWVGSIPESHVVARMMSFYQLIFKNQCFCFCAQQQFGELGFRRRSRARKSRPGGAQEEAAGQPAAWGADWRGG